MLLNLKERNFIKELAHKELKGKINPSNSAVMDDYLVVQLKNGQDLEIEFSTKKFREYLFSFQIDKAINYMKKRIAEEFFKDLFKGGQ